jgi:putative holliday junction resolvase
MPETKKSSAILALDVGERRIGVARSGLVARLASPLTTLENSPDLMERIANLAAEEDAGLIVVGLPRGMSGQDTDQTRMVRKFAADLQEKSGLPVVFQDEALTSVKAEAELKSRKKPYEKGAVDALAATYILEDYLISGRDS